MHRGEAGRTTPPRRPSRRGRAPASRLQGVSGPEGARFCRTPSVPTAPIYAHTGSPHCPPSDFQPCSPKWKEASTHPSSGNVLSAFRNSQRVQTRRLDSDLGGYVRGHLTHPDARDHVFLRATARGSVEQQTPAERGVDGTEWARRGAGAQEGSAGDAAGRGVGSAEDLLPLCGHLRRRAVTGLRAVSFALLLLLLLVLRLW